ncbi:MAG: hypothetical protein J0L69_07415 [Bacteroidetes bacterium]|nr:hypothetical protein [Bacteroidota bacterium]
MGIGKKFKGNQNIKDNLSEHFSKSTNSKTPINKSVENPTSNFGYCIRTGERIPFNPSKPYSDKAYKSWSQYKNSNYKEKYCHKTGKESNGKTSMANPILND